MSGPAGMAHTFGGLVALQDAPVDLAHYYAGTSARWGLFDYNGIINTRGMAFEIFSDFLRRADDEPRRLSAKSDHADVCAPAARETHGQRIRIAAASQSDTIDSIDVQIHGVNRSEWHVDRIAVHDYVAASAVLPPPCRTDSDGATVTVAISGPRITILELTPATAKRRSHARVELPSRDTEQHSGDW